MERTAVYDNIMYSWKKNEEQEKKKKKKKKKMMMMMRSFTLPRNALSGTVIFLLF